MPARIVVVHDDLAFTERIVTVLTTAGYDVAAFMNTGPARPPGSGRAIPYTLRLQRRRTTSARESLH
jgi:hypothetical protein